jgi:tetratricopeptide (TPR) repeat protein
MAERRSRQHLEQAVAAARTRSAKSRAHFALALFHDNNSREREAIPHYKAALSIGLGALHHAEALAWLASSLHKTGRPRAALQLIEQARDRAPSGELRTFLNGLERRVRRALSS